MISKKYIAGFFDGEGSIYITLINEKPTKLRPNGRKRYAMQISITNTAKDILFLIQSMYDGKIYQHSSGCWVWKLCQRDLIKNFLLDIEPYMLIKRQQAKIAFEYLDTVLDNKKYGFHPISVESNLIRKNCMEKIKLEHSKFSTKN